MQIMIILQFYATGTFQLMPNEDSFGLSLYFVVNVKENLGVSCQLNIDGCMVSHSQL